MKIFVSYSRRDSMCAEKVVRQLEAQGYDVWFDKHSIPGGEAWLKFIREGIRASGVTLVLWSEHSSQSEYVKKEFELALTHEISSGMKIIQLRLDKTALHSDLRPYQALPLQNCSNPEIHDLVKRLDQYDHLTRRVTHKLQANRQLKDYKDVRHIQGLSVAMIPFMRSAHTEVFVFGEETLALSDILQPETPVIQLISQFLGSQNDNTLRQVYQTIKSRNGEDETEKVPFFGLYITGVPQSGKYSLDNERSGEWLDAVNTSYEAASSLVGRGALLQVFTAMPAALAMAAGRPFYKFWHLQVFNYLREEQRRNPEQHYAMVLDTRDLGQRFD